MVCKNCGYNNRDGVGFCRHCGISLKMKSRRRVETRPSAVKAKRYSKMYGDFLDTQNTEKPPDIQADEEERLPRGGANFKPVTTAIGMVVIACFIAFCIFAFDLLIFPGSGGSITVDSASVPSQTPAPKLTPSPTPVPTVASSPADDYESLFIVPSD